MKKNIDELYDQAMSAFNRREFETAENGFRQILTLHPKFADIHNKLGIIYNQTGRLNLAAKAFQKAIEINPSYTEASLNLAITLSEQGKYEKSRDVFEKAAHLMQSAPKALDPFIRGKIANEHLRVGNIYAEVGLLDDAIEEYRKALRLSPTYADILTQLGIALRDKGAYDAAIKEFNRAKEQNPRFIPARIHLGIAYYSRGFYGLAEQEWREALRLAPDDSAVKTYLSFIKPQHS